MHHLTKHSSDQASSPRHAFTLVELLVVLGVLALLATLPVTGYARTREKSKRIQCLSNLKQFGLSMLVYGAEFQGKLPVLGSGYWAWDLDVAVADQLMTRGAQRNIMYDPACPEQNSDTAWNYGSVHMIGYALTFSGAGGVTVTNVNYSLIPKPVTSGGITYPAPLPAGRALVACATISLGADTANRASNQYYNIYGGWGPHRAAHLEGTIPSGGNVAMLDGSVPWVPFDRMTPRATTLTFWW